MRHNRKCKGHHKCTKEKSRSKSKKKESDKKTPENSPKGNESKLMEFNPIMVNMNISLMSKLSKNL